MVYREVTSVPSALSNRIRPDQTRGCAVYGCPLNFTRTVFILSLMWDTDSFEWKDLFYITGWNRCIKFHQWNKEICTSSVRAGESSNASILNMPDTRLIKPKPVATKPKHVNKKASTAETTPAVRTRDVGHRKNRASSCPRCTRDTEYKPKATERSNKAIQAKPAETSTRSKPAKYAPKEQPMPKTYSHARSEIHR